MLRALLLVLLALSSTSCIVQAPTSEGTQATAPRPATAPPAEVKSGANFGDKVELTTVILNPSRVVTGESLKVSLNFKVLQAIDRDYLIFVHVEDVEGRTDRLNVDHPPRAKPTSQWQPGELVRDDFEVPIPPGMPVRGVTLILGLWDPKSDQRMPIVNKDVVRTDGKDRLIVASIPVVQP